MRSSTILLSLSFGAFLTLASAWIPCAFLDIHTGKLHNLEHEPSVSTPAYVGAPADWRLRTWHECWGPGLRYDLASECIWMGSTIGMSPSTAPNRTMLRMTAGFPVPCMQWNPYADNATPRAAAKSPWCSGIDLPGKGLIGQGVERALPLRPLLWPLVINIGLYWALSLALLGALGAWKSSQRRRRGLCARCSYPLADLSTCPECGTLTRARPCPPAQPT